MDFVKQLEAWAKADASQGKLMLLVGFVLLISLYFVFRNSDPFVRGMLIPIGLLSLVYLGYGGFLTSSRPTHMINTSESYTTNPSETVNKEITKARADHSNYSKLRPVWLALIVLSLALTFFLSGEYYRGLSLGFAIMFFGALLIDTFLHRHLKPYLETLEGLV